MVQIFRPPNFGTTHSGGFTIQGVSQAGTIQTDLKELKIFTFCPSPGLLEFSFLQSSSREALASFPEALWRHQINVLFCSQTWESPNSVALPKVQCPLFNHFYLLPSTYKTGWDFSLYCFPSHCNKKYKKNLSSVTDFCELWGPFPSLNWIFASALSFSTFYYYVVSQWLQYSSSIRWNLSSILLL